jgi:hypothetical protein
VLWIGGPPAVGKTSVATRLARRYGLRWYNADTQTWRHRDRALAEGNEAARRWEALTPEERMRTPTAEMLEMWIHVERGPMVVDDVRRLPATPLVVAEGTTVPASIVSDGAAEPRQAIWLLPTPFFHLAQLSSHPPGAKALYLALAEQIASEVREHRAPTLTVDESRGLGAVFGVVEEVFSEAFARGPRAEDAVERRTLLREANEAIVAQVRGYYARPWAEGDADDVRRTFLCECGDPVCEEDVETNVAAASRAPVLAPRHEV